jgi:hypothetical protein
MSAKNILEFIGIENQNQIISIANLKGELAYLQSLDDMYREIVRIYSPNKNVAIDVVIGMSFLKAHSELYAGMSQLLCCHLDKALLSIRIAIDSAFNAYHISLNPKQAEGYVNPKSEEQKTFRNLKKIMKRYPETYPLAQHLIPIHEIASSYSAHSDINSFAFKYKHGINDETNKEQILIHYFTNMSNDEFFSWFFAHLEAHYSVFMLFHECFFSKALKIIDPEREKRWKDFEKQLLVKRKQYPLNKS